MDTMEYNEQFYSHCYSNNLEGVNDCLSRGVDVNTKKQTFKRGQWTGLMVACKHGNPAIVSRLVQVPGLDINYQDEYQGDTAAYLASSKGHTECVRILTETDRVDWNKADNWGCTPLYEALKNGHSDIVDIIVQQSNIDYNVMTDDGETLAQVAVDFGDVKCVETLTAQERCDCWNVPNSDGDTPIMMALKEGKTELAEILLRCPRVDLNCREEESWSLVLKTIQGNKLDLVKMILSKLEKPYYGSSLARIAVEVGEEEDIRRLVQTGSVDWNETAEDEDPAILWALKNEKFRIVDILMAVNKINLQGDPSADLTINCDSETFRVHKYFLCSKSPVFRARLERWEREGEININTMKSDTLSSMIHYIYTGELADGWQDLDSQDVTTAAEMYDLSGWRELFSSEESVGGALRNLAL